MPTPLRRPVTLLLLLALLLPALTFPTPARAAGIVVATLADTSPTLCTLRDAIVAANTDAPANGCGAGSGADTITFQAGLTGTITLGSDLPAVTTTMTITGPGTDDLMVTRADGDATNAFTASAGGNLTLAALTVQGGDHGILVNPNGAATLTNITLNNNSTGLYLEAGGTATLNSTIINGGVVGIIFNTGGTATLTNTTVRNNEYGLYFGENGTATVRDSTFSNSSFGAIHFLDGGTATLTNTTISASSKGILFNGGGTATLTNTTVTDNSGAGLYFSSGGTATLTDTTLSGNQYGLYFDVDGTATLTNTTLSGNQYGLIFSTGGTATLTNATISGSTDGLIFSRGGTATLTNATLSGNITNLYYQDGGAATPHQHHPRRREERPLRPGYADRRRRQPRRRRHLFRGRRGQRLPRRRARRGRPRLRTACRTTAAPPGRSPWQPVPPPSTRACRAPAPPPTSAASPAPRARAATSARMSGSSPRPRPSPRFSRTPPRRGAATPPSSSSAPASSRPTRQRRQRRPLQRHPARDHLPLRRPSSSPPSPPPSSPRAGTFPVTVVSPAPGGGTSNALPFVVAEAATSPSPSPTPSPLPSPTAALAPPSLTFGPQTVGTTSATQAATLSNTGTVPLAINVIIVSGDFAQTNDCPASLPASAQCTIAVSFTPAVAGGRSGVLSVFDNAGNSPQSVTLGGTGVASSSPSPAPVTHTVAASAVGRGTVTPSGTTTYPAGNTATYAATPAPGQVFIGWTLDGVYVGYPATLAFTVNSNRTLVATFAARPTFGDVPTTDPDYQAITFLAAAGVDQPGGGQRLRAVPARAIGRPRRGRRPHRAHLRLGRRVPPQ